MIDYLLSLAPIVAVYIVLAVSLNVVMGNTGVLSVAQAAFMGVGAYATGLLTVDHGWPVLATIPVGCAISAVLGALLMLPALRIQGMLFAVVSFAFMIVLQGVFTNADGLTHGATGVSGIPFLSFGGWNIQTNGGYTIVYGIITVLVVLLHWRISASPFGLMLRAVRDDVTAAAALGMNTVAARLKVFVLGACLASISGSMYAPLIRYVDPTNFSVFLSFLVISMVVLGGTGSVFGAVVGATLLTLLPNAVTFLNLSSTIGGALAQIIYAAVLIIVLRVRPSGLIPQRSWRVLRTFRRSDRTRVSGPAGPTPAATIEADG